MTRHAPYRPGGASALLVCLALVLPAAPGVGFAQSRDAQRPRDTPRQRPVQRQPDVSRQPESPPRQTPPPRLREPQRVPEAPPRAVAVLSLDQAVSMAERRYSARVVRTDVDEQRGRRIYVLRLLSEEGRVWTVRVDAATGSML